MKTKKKKIPASVDVPGRIVSWMTEGGSRLYGEVARVYLEHYKPENALYDKQRFLRKRLVVVSNDGRVFDMSGQWEDLKKIQMVAE